MDTSQGTERLAKVKESLASFKKAGCRGAEGASRNSIGT